VRYKQYEVKVPYQVQKFKTETYYVKVPFKVVFAFQPPLSTSFVNSNKLNILRPSPQCTHTPWPYLIK